MALHRNDKILAVILAIFGVFAVWYLAGSAPIGTRDNPLADPKASKLGTVWVGQTANYQVTSWATVQQTTQVGSNAEGLLRAYLQFFSPYMVAGVLLQVALAFTLEMWRRMV